MNKILFKKTLNWLLLLVSIGFLISGYGITHYQFVRKLTLGIFSKPFFFWFHSALSPVFIILMLLHVLKIRNK